MGAMCSGTASHSKHTTLKESLHNVVGADHEVAKDTHHWPTTFFSELEAGLNTHRQKGWSMKLFLGMVDVRTLAELSPKSVDVLRAVTDAASACGQIAVPSSIQQEKANANGVKCTWAWPRAYKTAAEAPAHLLYCHGGAFCLGSPDTHVQMCARIAELANCAVLIPAYSRCPEHPLSAAVEDCEKAYAFMLEYLKKQGKPSGDEKMSNVIIGGESAGGNLAVQVAQRIANKKSSLPQAKALAIMSPWVDLHDSVEQVRGSWAENEGSDFVLGKLAYCFAKWVLGAQQHGGVKNPGSKEGKKIFDALDDEALKKLAKSPDASPALGELAGLPRTHVATGSCETLRDSQLEFVEKLKGAGVEVQSKVYKDMPHAVGLANFMVGAEEGPNELLRDFAKFMVEVCGHQGSEELTQSPGSKGTGCCG